MTTVNAHAFYINGNVEFTAFIYYRLLMLIVTYQYTIQASYTDNTTILYDLYIHKMYINVSPKSIHFT